LNLDDQINEIEESDEDEDDGKADWGSIFNAEDTPSYLPSKPLDPVQEQRVCITFSNHYYHHYFLLSISS